MDAHSASDGASPIDKMTLREKAFIVAILRDCLKGGEGGLKINYKSITEQLSLSDVKAAPKIWYTVKQKLNTGNGVDSDGHPIATPTKKRGRPKKENCTPSKRTKAESLPEDNPIKMEEKGGDGDADEVTDEMGMEAGDTVDDTVKDEEFGSAI